MSQGPTLRHVLLSVLLLLKLTLEDGSDYVRVYQCYITCTHKHVRIIGQSLLTEGLITHRSEANNSFFLLSVIFPEPKAIHVCHLSLKSDYYQVIESRYREIFC